MDHLFVEVNDTDYASIFGSTPIPTYINAHSPSVSTVGEIIVELAKFEHTFCLVLYPIIGETVNIWMSNLPRYKCRVTFLANNHSLYDLAGRSIIFIL